MCVADDQAFSLGIPTSYLVYPIYSVPFQRWMDVLESWNLDCRFQYTAHIVADRVQCILHTNRNYQLAFKTKIINWFMSELEERIVRFLYFIRFTVKSVTVTLISKWIKWIKKSYFLYVNLYLGKKYTFSYKYIYTYTMLILKF